MIYIYMCTYASLYIYIYSIWYVETQIHIWSIYDIYIYTHKEKDIYIYIMYIYDLFLGLMLKCPPCRPALQINTWDTPAAVRPLFVPCSSAVCPPLDWYIYIYTYICVCIYTYTNKYTCMNGGFCSQVAHTIEIQRQHTRAKIQNAYNANPKWIMNDTN